MIFIWKCQKCSSELFRKTKSEPRICEHCLDRGVKSFIQERKYVKPTSAGGEDEKG